MDREGGRERERERERVREKEGKRAEEGEIRNKKNQSTRTRVGVCHVLMH